MRTTVVYESMFGNTRVVAQAIAAGLADAGEVTVRRVGEVQPDDVSKADLLIIGGPTHAWSMSRPRTRRGAAQTAATKSRDLVLEPGADGPGLREWIATVPPASLPRRVACFDTRMHAPLGLSGSAGRALARRLRSHGAVTATAGRVQPFFVDKKHHLLAGEAQRAEAWGERLATLSPTKQ